MEATIRNSDLAKIETKAKLQTNLSEFTDCSSKAPTGKTTEELIQKHAKDFTKKSNGKKNRTSTTNGQFELLFLHLFNCFLRAASKNDGKAQKKF